MQCIIFVFRMNFVLDQLKTSNSLTTRYALYHGLAVISDIIALTLVLLYTLNFTVFGLDSELPPLDLGDGYNTTTWSSLFRLLCFKCYLRTY